MNVEQIKTVILREAIQDSIHLLIEIAEGDTEQFLSEAYSRLIKARLELALKNSENLK